MVRPPRVGSDRSSTADRLQPPWRLHQPRRSCTGAQGLLVVIANALTGLSTTSGCWRVACRSGPTVGPRGHDGRRAPGRRARRPPRVPRVPPAGCSTDPAAGAGFDAEAFRPPGDDALLARSATWTSCGAPVRLRALLVACRPRGGRRTPCCWCGRPPGAGTGPAAARARRRDHRAGARARPRRVGRAGSRSTATGSTSPVPDGFVVRGDDPGGAAEIHGLTRDDLAAGTPLPEVLRELRAALDGSGAARPPRDLRPRLPAGGVPRGGGADAAGARGLHAHPPQAAAPRRRPARSGRPGRCGSGRRASGSDCRADGPTTRSATRSPAPSSTSARSPSSGRGATSRCATCGCRPAGGPGRGAGWRRRWWRARRRWRRHRDR